MPTRLMMTCTMVRISKPVLMIIPPRWRSRYTLGREYLVSEFASVICWKVSHTRHFHEPRAMLVSSPEIQWLCRKSNNSFIQVFCHEPARWAACLLTEQNQRASFPPSTAMDAPVSKRQG